AFAIAVGEVDVDVGCAFAVFAQEALEEQAEFDGVDGGDAEAEADDGVGGGAAALAKDAFAAREADDVPDDQEVAGHAELADHVELVGDLGPIEGSSGVAAWGKRPNGLGEVA